MDLGTDSDFCFIRTSLTDWFL